MIDNETRGENTRDNDELLISEYVVISDEEVNKLIGCSNAELEKVTDFEAMKAMFQDEVKKNQRFLQKLKEISKKYRKAVKKIEYQDLLITELSTALKNEQENSKNGFLSEDFAHIAYGSLKIEECEER